MISHSHYDHVAGLPAVRKAWPGVKVYGSERAREILLKPSALSVIRSLSGDAAEAAEWTGTGITGMKISESMSVLEDGETVKIGNHSVLAFETTGHTKCQLSYIVDGELMLCSESVGGWDLMAVICRFSG
ncbi:MAG: MBL fold metallo-hydrolase [Eisenbergiella sp.]